MITRLPGKKNPGRTSQPLLALALVIVRRRKDDLVWVNR